MDTVGHCRKSQFGLWSFQICLLPVAQSILVIIPLCTSLLSLVLILPLRILNVFYFCCCCFGVCVCVWPCLGEWVSQFPDQGQNLWPLHWKLRVLTTGPPGTSLSLMFQSCTSEMSFSLSLTLEGAHLYRPLPGGFPQLFPFTTLASQLQRCFLSQAPPCQSIQRQCPIAADLQSPQSVCFRALITCNYISFSFYLLLSHYSESFRKAENSFVSSYSPRAEFSACTHMRICCMNQ